MGEFYVERRKWPDRPHYRHAAEVLGDDEFGLWVVTRAGTPVMRGDDVLFEARHDGVMCVADGRRWMAWFTAAHDFDLYCDIVTPISIGPAGSVAVDLDLDVVRWADGRVELLDEDEFESHRVELGYPEDECVAALRTADEVVRAVRLRAAPFDGWVARWFAVAARSGSA